MAPSYKTRLLTYEIVTKEEYGQGYKNILKTKTTTYNQSLALEILTGQYGQIRKSTNQA